ncbi:hypothetical protein HDU92_005844 [Lobulomyces angularis]|nr:hypothetical protein HDU92_005844 [Lobulomyces angularis]
MDVPPSISLEEDNNIGILDNDINTLLRQAAPATADKPDDNNNINCNNDSTVSANTDQLQQSNVFSVNPTSEISKSSSLRMQSPNQIKSVPIQLIPFSDTHNVRPALFEVIERRMKEGEVVGIGRLSSKNPTAEPTFINIKAKVVSRIHAQLIVKDGKVYIKDIGSSSGTFLNKNRLSPTLKESAPTLISEGDILYFGAEYKDKNDGDYFIFKIFIKYSNKSNTIVVNRRVSFKFGYYDQSWIAIQKLSADTATFRGALKNLLKATSPIAKLDAVEEDAEQGTDCCICISEIGPFQALFMAPCSHCYHYKCVQRLLFQSPMFQCPMCRQVANLSASLSSENLKDLGDENKYDNNPDRDNNGSSGGNEDNAREEPENSNGFEKKGKGMEEAEDISNIGTKNKNPLISAESNNEPEQGTSSGIGKRKISFAHKVSSFFQKVSSPAPSHSTISSSTAVGETAILNVTRPSSSNITHSLSANHLSEHKIHQSTSHKEFLTTENSNNFVGMSRNLSVNSISASNTSKINGTLNASPSTASPFGSRKSFSFSRK